MTLEPSIVDIALAELEGWTNDGDAITKTYAFKDFKAAMDFMQRAAGPIDEANHHPEWTNVYNRVDVRLSSHDAGGITDRDINLAKVLDSLVEAPGA
jgi:4a-hydroxytetrahydrobiopterin dehydratase